MTERTADSDSDGVGRRRMGAGLLWVLSFLGFLMMIGAWSLAAPYDGTPDEREHVIRAAGVAGGEIAPEPADAKKGSGAFQTVPRGLVREQCWQFKPEKPASCAVPPGSDRTPVRAGSGAGRYHPVYYAMVGWPLQLWPGWPGVLLARLISGAASAALLAGAFVVAVRRSRHRLLIAGLLAAVTPMAAHMASAVNPNGLEIAAGVAFFTGMIPLFLGDPTVRRRGLLALVGISALLLAMLRQTGPLWLAVAFVAFAFPLRRGNLPALLRSWAVRWWTLAVAVAVGTAVLWGRLMKTSDLGDYGGNRWTYGQALVEEANRWRGYLDQIVGVTSWLDTKMPAPAYLLWQYAAATLLVAALVFGRWADRWRLAVLLLGAVVVPSAAQVAFVKETGFISQGRYMMPMLAGVLIFAAYVLEERGLGPVRSRSLVRLLVVLLLPIHLFVLVVTMVRWQHGLPKLLRPGDLDPFAGPWHPLLGSALPLALSVAGLTVFGVLAWSMAGFRPLGAATGATTTATAAGATTTGRPAGAEETGTGVADAPAGDVPSGTGSASTGPNGTDPRRSTEIDGTEPPAADPADASRA